MTGIEAWSTTAASNNAAPPNGWPEGQSPSSVNDCARQMMASLRTWYQDAQWMNLGYTHVYVGATQFKIAGVDVTSFYPVGRRVRAVGTSTGTIYGTITVSAFSTDTTITVLWDSGSLSNETLTVSVGILTLTNGASTAAAPFIDSTAIMKGSADGTKLLKIEVDGLTTATTRTWTAPDADLTVVGTATTQTLTNKKLSDSTCTIVDDGDNTKQLAFQCSGITTGTTRTVTVPDASGTIIYNSTQTAIQQVRTETGAVATGSTVIPVDDTIPQISEGVEYMTLAITPTNSANKLVIEVVAFLASSANDNIAVALFQDATASALAAGAQVLTTTNKIVGVKLIHVMTAGTTSATTFRVRAGLASAGTITFNGISGARIFGGVMASSIVITEYSS